MRLATLVSFLGFVGVGAACGGEPAPAKAPEAPTEAPVASASTPAPTPSGAWQAEPGSGQKAMEGAFLSITRAANSGKEDKIGETDGDFKPDGVKDLVFDVEFKGAVAAFFLVLVDAEGTPTGAFDADSLAGKEVFPGEISPTRDPRDVNAGIVVYKDGKMLSRPGGGLTVFPDEVHKLVLRVSSKRATNGPMRAFAMLADKSIVTGPVVPGSGK